MRPLTTWPGYDDAMAWVLRNTIGADALEIVNLPLFDSQLYPLAGTAGAITFFTTGIGQGKTSQSGQTGTKTALDTNLNANGQLSAPNGFFATHLELDVLPGSVTTTDTWTIQSPVGFATDDTALVQAGAIDANAILSSGLVTLTVNSRIFVQDAPLYKFKPQNQIRLDSSVANVSATTPGEVIQQKLYVEGDCYPILPGLFLQYGVNFQVSVQWGAAVAVVNNAKIMARLRGFLFRSKGS
jgi:hypothetical protein